jgi:hypothetical protein
MRIFCLLKWTAAIILTGLGPIASLAAIGMPICTNERIRLKRGGLLKVAPLIGSVLSPPL